MTRPAGSTATNPETGERLILNSIGQMVPVRPIVGPANETYHFDDSADQPRMIPIIRGTTPTMGRTGYYYSFDDQDWYEIPQGVWRGDDEPGFSTGDAVSYGRQANLFQEGLQSGLSSALGFLPWLALQGTNAVGLTDADPNVVTDAVKGGIESLIEGVTGDDYIAPEPINARERLVYGLGRGPGEAAGWMGPAAPFRAAAGVGGRLARWLTTAPLTQTTAATAGAAVGETTQDPLLGIGTALATPFALSGISRMATPMQAGVSAERQRLIDIADEIPGMTEVLPLAARTGSSRLGALESTLAQRPGTGQAVRYEQARDLWLQEVRRRAGIAGDDMSPATLNAAYADLGRRFDDLASRHSIDIDQRLMDNIEGVYNNFLGSRTSTDIPPVISNQVTGLLERITNPQTGGIGATIPGQQLQDYGSRIRELARRAPPGEIRHALYDLSNVLDDALERTLGGSELEAYRALRGQYRNFIVVRDAAGRATAETGVDGAFNPAALRAAVVAMEGRPGFAMGRGDMNDMSRLGQAIYSAIPNDSGTAQRNFWQSLLNVPGAMVRRGGMIGAPLGGTAGAADMLMTGAQSFDPAFVVGGTGVAAASAPLSAAANLAWPPVLDALLHNPAARGYLSNQLLRSAPALPMTGRAAALQGAANAPSMLSPTAPAPGTNPGEPMRIRVTP